VLPPLTQEPGRRPRSKSVSSDTTRNQMINSVIEQIEIMTKLVATINRQLDERSDYFRDIHGPLRDAITRLKAELDELDKKT